MRLLFFIPALFMALALHAQPICQISDLVTVVTATDPAACKFSVKLDFKHQGTTNQFNVKGNGVDYGNFTYTSLPVTLGPIMGQANAPTELEFIVSDLVLNCKAETKVTLPACPTVGPPCVFENASATPGNCLPGGGFTLKIDFKVQATLGNFFEVTTAGGLSLGVFPLAALPLTIPNFPSNGTTDGVVKVCIKDQPDCCKTIEFKAPLCPADCGWIVQPDTGKCTSDSTYSMMFKIFSPNPVPPTDSFLVYANGDYIGTYAWNQLPVTVPNFPWGGGAFDVIEVCAKNPINGAKCCSEAEFLAPKCLPYEPCAMSRIKLEVDSCTTDSTFRVTVNFLVADPTKVDSFTVWADGELLGKFGLNQLPLTLPNYPWTEGTIFSTIRICTGNSPACCRERQFVVLRCLPFGDCKVKDIQIKTGPCRPNGTFKATINFQATNPGNGTFTVFGNGVPLGIFPLSAAPVMVNFPSNGTLPDVVRVCVNQPDPNTVLCCESKQFEGPDCPILGCEIKDLKVDVGDCTTDGKYKAIIKFAVQNPPTQKFTVFSNGQNLGNFDLSQLPLSVLIPSNGAAADVVKVCIGVIAPIISPCCAEVEFQGPDCGPCEIFDLKVEVGACTSDSTYKAIVKFNVQNPPSQEFRLQVNGQDLGVFNLSQLPLTLNNFPTNGAATDVLKVCMVASNSVACCRTIEFQGPACNNQGCEIFDLKVDVGACTSDSTYKAVIKFSVQNPPSSQFTLTVNGQNLGTFNLSQLPLTLNNFPSNGTAIDVLKVCIQPNSPAQTPCCRTIEFQGPVCNNQGCEIFDLKVDVGACTSDSTYKAIIKFSVQNPPSQQFTLTVNGQNLGTFNLSQLPLTLNNFPSNGAAIDVLKVCMVVPGALACCKTIEFQGPACAVKDCEIFDLKVDVGPCTSDSTYKATIKFNVQNPPSQEFRLQVNGQNLGVFNLNQLPLILNNFPANGPAIDVVKVCMVTPDPNQVTCCRTIEFYGPLCLGGNCEILDLKVEVGACTSDSTYKVKINFAAQNPISGLFTVTANGQNLGTFNLSQLPLTLTNFPSNGAAIDVLKVCIVASGAVACCKTIEFEGKSCGNQGCEVFDLKVDVSDCTSDSTYKAKVSFGVHNPPSGQFVLFVNGQNLGTFNLSQLPLTLTNFPSNGTATDVLKVCMVAQGALTCCKTIEFQGPACGNQPCEIYDLKVLVGDCTSDSTYKLTLDFKVQNPGNNFFEVWAGGNKYLGIFPLSSLPLTINNYPSGPANYFLKVCINDQPNCCRTVQFQGKICNGPCEISNLKVDVGICTGDSTYKVTIDFDATGNITNMFSVTGNGQFLGFYNLSQLPLTITNFPWNGGTHDVVEVCVVTAPGIACCKKLEFKVPDCLLNPVCEIYDLTVQVGDCTSDSTYKVKIDFEVTGNTTPEFMLWANGQSLGIFKLSDLPLTITDFPWDGGTFDVVKVCMKSSDPAASPCCRTKEFAVPACLQQCNIVDLEIAVGDCTSDSTYKLRVNFQVTGSQSNVFGVWANGVNIGFYNLNQLPLTITNFPSNGGANDVIKICMMGSNTGQVLCCVTKEFPVPPCINMGCKIWDLQVIKTPCLCGKFFAVVTFKHQNGGSGGFDIVGNGQNYGNYPYSHPQPIIIGPLMGDGTTQYEFGVKDHLHPDCNDALNLGKVECATPTDELASGGGRLSLSPNPASERLNVTAQLDGISSIGQVQVEVRHADGRLVLTSIAADGNNFQLDVSTLASGVYRLTVLAERGRLEGSFVKSE